jgi:hypothetical protein
MLSSIGNRGKFPGKQLQHFLLATAAMNDINRLRHAKPRPTRHRVQIPPKPMPQCMVA